MALLSKLDHKNFGLLVIRVGLGISMVLYGYPKLLGGPDGWTELGTSTKHVGINFLPVVWGFLAAVTETLGGLFILIGFAFRPACILLVINLIVAASVHLAGGEGHQGAGHAIELAFVLAGLLFVGPGKYSVDKR
jgi:putative oxidoreductase